MAVVRSKFLLPWLEDARKHRRHETGVESEHEPFKTAISFNFVRSIRRTRKSNETILRRRPRPPPPPPLPRVQALAIDGVPTAEVVKVRLKSR